MLFSIYDVTTTHAQEKGGEAGVVLGEMGRLIEKYAPEAALQAAKMLPKVIDDAASDERARKILDNSATTLPGEGFLQISGEGVCRLYIIDNQNKVIAVNATSLSQIFVSPNLRGRKTLIVDEQSARAYWPQLESVKSQFDLYTVSGIEPPVRMTFETFADKSKSPSTTHASALAAKNDQTWTATDLFLFGIIGLVVFLGARRLYRNFMKGYQGKT